MEFWSRQKKSAISVLAVGVLLIMGLQLVACGKKSEAPIRSGDSDGERDPREGARGGQQRDRMGVLEVISSGAQSRRVAFTFAVGQNLLRLEGDLGRESTERAADSKTDGYEVFYRSYEDFSVVAAILARKNQNKGQFFLFVENSRNRYDSLIDGIEISVDRELVAVTRLIRHIMDEQKVTLANAFALIIDRHRKNPKASFKALDDQIREAIRRGDLDREPRPEVRVIPGRPSDRRDREDRDRDTRDRDQDRDLERDDESRVVIEYNPCYASRNQDLPACAPSQRHQSVEDSGPSHGSHGSVSRPSASQRPALPVERPGSVSERVEQARPQTCAATIPEPIGYDENAKKPFHRWEDCLKSAQWETWGSTIWDQRYENTRYCVPRNDCSKDYWDCCGNKDRIETLGKCRIISAGPKLCGSTGVHGSQAAQTSVDATPQAGSQVSVGNEQVHTEVITTRCGGVPVSPVSSGAPRCGGFATIVESSHQAVAYSGRGSLRVRCADGETGTNSVRFPNTSKLDHEIDEIHTCLPHDGHAWAVELKHESVWWLKRNFTSLLLGNPQYSGDAELVFHLDFSRVHSDRSAHRAIKDITLQGGGFEVVSPIERIGGHSSGAFQGRVYKNFATAGDESCPDRVLLSCDVTYYPNSSNCQ